jgi:hypothetical protein
VELFDRHGVSFVSVTQQFNTATSMGRLTLNVLLSFAQFEREVTSERIRDKIAASKRKGLWVGGMAPFGYDTKDRRITINDAECVRTEMPDRQEVERCAGSYDELLNLLVLAYSPMAYLSAITVSRPHCWIGPDHLIVGRALKAEHHRHLVAVHKRPRDFVRIKLAELLTVPSQSVK